jgi:hypothetical protein
MGENIPRHTPTKTAREVIRCDEYLEFDGEEIMSMVKT